MINPMDLNGKRILVTGASSGLGRETAIHLSNLCAKVIIVARSEENLKKVFKDLNGEGHSMHLFDLKQIENIENFVNNIVKNEGKLNGLVHCAGIGDMRPLSITKYNFLHNMMLINFYSFIELIRIATKKNNYSENASFIAISSVASKKGDKSKTAYCATKGALDSAVRTMAKELSDKGIRINTIMPGIIKTDMYDLYLNNAGEEAVEKNIVTHQYMGLGEPIDIANAIAFLLSDASKFITGTGLVVDGGYLS